MPLTSGTRDPQFGISYHLLFKLERASNVCSDETVHKNSLVLAYAACKPRLKPNYHVLAYYTIALSCDRVYLETNPRCVH